MSRINYIGATWIIEVTSLRYDTAPYDPVVLTGSVVTCTIAGLTATTGIGTVETYEDFNEGDVRVRAQFSKEDTAALVLTQRSQCGEFEITLASGRRMYVPFKRLICSVS